MRDIVNAAAILEAVTLAEDDLSKLVPSVITLATPLNVTVIVKSADKDPGVRADT